MPPKKTGAPRGSSEPKRQSQVAPAQAPSLTRRKPTQSRSQETVRAILEATLRLMQEEGESALKMKRVAELAGVGVGSLYEYFPDKPSLIRAVEERSWEQQIPKLQALMVELDPLPTEDAIVRIVAFAMDAFAAQGAVHGITANDPATIEARRTMIHNLADFAAMQLATREPRIRPKNLRLALRMIIKLVAASTWIGLRDHPDEYASGELPREMGIMAARYLLRDPRDL